MTFAAPALSSGVSAPPRIWLVPAVTLAVYALLLLAGDQLLRDPDTYWQIAIGDWIVARRAVPHTDPYSWTMQGAPWISTQWLAQVALAASYRVLGWAGPVLLAAIAVATAFGLLARFVTQRLAQIPALVLMSAALALTVPHLLARPHVLALPVMVAFVGGLIAAMDRRVAPSFWLLPLMTLWANLHGGFVFGLALIGATGLGALLDATPPARRGLAIRWGLFGIAAMIAACVTPYGWDSILAARKILNLGQALALIGEWRAADFGHPGPLEIAVLGGFALALWRGVVLSPVRVLLLIGLVLMALGHVRNAEVLALIAPMLLAQPLGQQFGPGDAARPALPRFAIAGLALIVCAGTLGVLLTHRYAPDAIATPSAAVRALKQHNIARVLNDYDFGGYLIAAGVAPYIDGRTELYGEKLMVAHNSFSGLQNPDDFFRLIADPRVEATLLRTQSAATKMLDHMDGWRRVYGDDLAVVHVRDVTARAPAVPALRRSLD